MLTVLLCGYFFQRNNGDTERKYKTEYSEYSETLPILPQKPSNAVLKKKREYSDSPSRLSRLRISERRDTAPSTRFPSWVYYYMGKGTSELIHEADDKTHKYSISTASNSFSFISNPNSPRPSVTAFHHNNRSSVSFRIGQFGFPRPPDYDQVTMTEHPESIKELPLPPVETPHKSLPPIPPVPPIFKN